MTEAMPFLQKYDITFLRPPTISRGVVLYERNCIRTRADKIKQGNGRTGAP